MTQLEFAFVQCELPWTRHAVRFYYSKYYEAPTTLDKLDISEDIVVEMVTVWSKPKWPEGTGFEAWLK